MLPQNIKEKVKIVINGESMFFMSAKELLQYLLFTILDLKHSPVQVLVENAKQIFSFVLEYCRERKISSAGISVRSRDIFRAQTEEGFSRAFYDLLLSLEEMSLLHGFGISNSFKDRLPGNPERIRMSYEKK